MLLRSIKSWRAVRSATAAVHSANMTAVRCAPGRADPQPRGRMRRELSRRLYERRLHDVSGSGDAAALISTLSKPHRWGCLFGRCKRKQCSVLFLALFSFTCPTDGLGPSSKWIVHASADATIYQRVGRSCGGRRTSTEQSPPMTDVHPLGSGILRLGRDISSLGGGRAQDSEDSASAAGPCNTPTMRAAVHLLGGQCVPRRQCVARRRQCVGYRRPMHRYAKHGEVTNGSAFLVVDSASSSLQLSRIRLAGIAHSEILVMSASDTRRQCGPQ